MVECYGNVLNFSLVLGNILPAYRQDSIASCFCFVGLAKCNETSISYGGKYVVNVIKTRLLLWVNIMM